MAAAVVAAARDEEGRDEQRNRVKHGAGQEQPGEG